ncbi:PREDICTED: inactive serine/threonine-protein kinase VRK3 isoform X2 [Cyprinodon variegatus]|uniref:VRK serine/threonine kinase 3 n=2 Tax=Cyprinodon variegatus TaxID=28743 RepID=A0A3Q2E1A7_CYPVA|nr:PREDICTED: inactive serine/threonine-protein kinase VRK3 isoform X2 [Cyprinodon variegatus]XP_015254835.1 PREDICTED: inactive serine/threonine-protein kinase VRK3 isoform X2 [Cyprinodon variegatus]
MPFRFCPQCGTKLQPDFRFCPSCGEKLPCSADEAGLMSSPASVKDETTATSPASSLISKDSKSPVSPRPAIRKTRNSLQLDKTVKFDIQGSVQQTLLSSPPKSKEDEVKTVGSQTFDSKNQPEVKITSEVLSSPAAKSPRPVRGQAKVSSPVKREAEASDKTIATAEASKVERAAPSKSPLKGGGGKSKKAKHASLLVPLQEGEELTDKAGKKWKLVKLIGQNMMELLYEVTRPTSKEADHILKLGTKDGRIFTEQNFLQRAAKSTSVEKWIKQNRMDFLGIPSCIGFGLHADLYRFLVFPNMGCSLQSVLEEENEPLSERAVLQLACRILDVLEFIHSNEYVHADINAENIYIKPGENSQVYLVGYCHAVRYCPGGQHVEYREGSRTPHEGAVPFISLDAHNGAAPSRRSDLQSLGYCMLMWHTGTLPWSELTQPEQVAAQKRRYMDDVKALLSHCFGTKTVSSAFQAFLTAVMALQYTEQPSYSELQAGLSAALQQLGGSVEQPLHMSI